MTRLRHLSYSNVVSTLCLFLLLGGGTAYALDGSNTVFTDDIVNGEVKTGDIRDANITKDDLGPNSVNSAKVVDNSLTGGDVSESSLGFECPAGYELAGKDVCYEPGPGTGAHNNADFETALSTCAANGDRLPTLAEGWAVIADLPNPGMFLTEATWTADQSSGSAEAIFLVKASNGTITRNSGDVDSGNYFRCVTSPHG